MRHCHDPHRPGCLACHLNDVTSLAAEVMATARVEWLSAGVAGYVALENEPSSVLDRPRLPKGLRA